VNIPILRPLLDIPAVLRCPSCGCGDQLSGFTDSGQAVERMDCTHCHRAFPRGRERIFRPEKWNHPAAAELSDL
jgi:hypothetical protein